MSWTWKINLKTYSKVNIWFRVLFWWVYISLICYWTAQTIPSFVCGRKWIYSSVSFIIILTLISLSFKEALHKNGIDVFQWLCKIWYEYHLCIQEHIYMPEQYQNFSMISILFFLQLIRNTQKSVRLVWVCYKRGSSLIKKTRSLFISID